MLPSRTRSGRVARLASLAVAAAVCLGVAGPAAGAGEGPRFRPFRRLGLEEGLSHSSVYALAQDRHGFLWLGTQDGLDRWDGRRVAHPGRTATGQRRLSSHDVSSLLESATGHLWIGTWGGGLDRYDPESGEIAVWRRDPADPASMVDDRVGSLLETADGALWIGTYRGLDRYDPATGGFRHFRHDPADPGSLAHDRVWGLAADPGGALWVATEAGVDRLDPASGRAQHLGHPGGVAGAAAGDATRVRALHHDGAKLWLGTETGVYRLDPASAEATPVPLPGGPASINVFLAAPDGRLWIGSQGSGLFGLERTSGEVARFRHDPDREGSLPDDDVRALLVDAGGLLWVGTRGGFAARLDLSPPRFGLVPVPRTRTLREDDDGALWIGTADGLVVVDGEGERRYRHDPAVATSLAHDSVLSFLRDGQGRRWIGTYGGLSRLDPGAAGFLAFRHDPADPASLSNDAVEAVAQDARGRIWVGTRRGLDRFEPPAGFRPVRSTPAGPDALADDFVTTLLPARDGALWVGTDVGGLVRFDPETGGAERYRPDPADPESLSDSRVTCLLEDSRGTLWIGTGYGLDRLDRRDGEVGFSRFLEEDGLPSAAIQAMLEDEAGRLWISTTRGLARFDPERGVFRDFAVDDGLQGRQFSAGAAFRGPGGELFFGGRNGVNRFHPARISRPQHPPRVALVGLAVLNHPRDPGVPLESLRRLELAWPERFFAFELAALDFADPERNRFAYRLEGVDADWVEAGTRSFASYADVAPGRYVFRARATNADGVGSEDELALAVVVAPPWWGTTAFRAFAVLLLVVAAVSLHRLRLRAIRTQKAILEAEVRQRTAEVAERNRRLEIADDIVRFINEETELPDLLQSILEGVAFLLAADRALALVHDPRTARLELAARFGWDDLPERASIRPQTLEEVLVEPGVERAPGVTVTAGSAVAGDPALRERLRGRLGAPADAYLVMRIGAADRLLGYLVFASLRGAGTFDAVDQKTLGSLVGHVASAFSKGRMLAELRDLNAKKNEFLGIAAHDLRSPIGGIRSYAELLLHLLDQDRYDAEKFRRFLDNMRVISEQMLRLLAELLDVTAIETGRVQLQLARQRMTDILGEREPYQAKAAEKKQIALVVESEAALAEVWVDRLRVGEVLDNLMSNAVKYTPPGGRVRVWCERQDGELVTHVEDTGQGLEPEEIDKVFTGSKLSARPTGGETSTGLGLVIVKKLVELHGGRVWVRSEKARGSTFSFSLPLAS